MHFVDDAFISYAHLDDVALIEGSKGWVTNLHSALEKRLPMFLGKQPHIWRDPKLKGNDVFSVTLVEKLHSVALLLTVVSPRYVKSESTRKELSAFWEAAENQGGAHFRDRVFKVVMIPVPLEEQPPELQPLLGYEFFKIEPHTGKIRCLNPVFGKDAEVEFWLELDDLAQELCERLERLEMPETPRRPTGPSVFLAETTSDLQEQREALRRDLQQHGYTVFPNVELPSVASRVQALLNGDLDRCQLSVMLVGKHYSLTPEGSKDSLLEIQNRLSIERAKKGDFSRLVWIPKGLQVEDDRQSELIDRLRLDPALTEGSDLLETTFEDLKTVIHDQLKRSGRPEPEEVKPTGYPSVYLVYDRPDSEAASLWADQLYDQHFDVLLTDFDGTPEAVREYHNKNLRNCDGILIFFGSTSQSWVHGRWDEIKNAGRAKPASSVGIVVTAPGKARLHINGPMLLQQVEGFSADLLQKFAVGLKH